MAYSVRISSNTRIVSGSGSKSSPNAVRMPRRSLASNCWPLVRARMRGSAMLMGVLSGAQRGLFCDWRWRCEEALVTMRRWESRACSELSRCESHGPSFSRGLLRCFIPLSAHVSIVRHKW